MADAPGFFLAKNYNISGITWTKPIEKLHFWDLLVLNPIQKNSISICRCLYF